MNTQAPPETYTVSIPSVALARMAADLAVRRVYGPSSPASAWFGHGDGSVSPGSRYTGGPAAQEYYRILDRLTRGEKP